MPSGRSLRQLFKNQLFFPPHRINDFLFSLFRDEYDLSEVKYFRKLMALL